MAYGGDTLPTFNLEFDVVDRPVTPLLVLADPLNIDLVQLHSEVYEVDGPRTGGSVSSATVCPAGGREFDSGRTNTQGLKITEEKVMPL